MDVFVEISLILVVATLIAALMQLLRQPLIIGHIITGLIVGPTVLDLVHSAETVELFSHMGIALLLFIIGLGLNPRVIKEVGKIAVMTGVGQILFTSTIGFLVAQALGFSAAHSVYIALGLSFSSTIIILKLLSDRKDTHRLYGKIATGFLLVQDIVAVMALVAVTALGQDQSLGEAMTSTLLSGAAFIGGIVLVSIYVLPHLQKFLSRSQEFLFLFAIGWGFGVASLAYAIGFSIEIGALAAGVALASSPYAFEVASKMRPLRDFFIVLFFIILGAELDIMSIGSGLLPATALSILILIGNPIIVMSIMGALKFKKKTGFKAGLTVAQISEFSLILLLLAREQNFITDEIVSMMTLVAMVTIAVSTYMIIYSDKLYDWLEPYLSIFERKNTRDKSEGGDKHDVILFGYKTGSHTLIDSFKKINKKYLVVDYNPEVIESLNKQNINALYGDANDAEFLEDLSLESTKMVIAATSDHSTNVLVSRHILECNPKAVVIAKAEESNEADVLYDIGVHYVMMPHFLGSRDISRKISRYGLKSHDYFAKAKQEHINHLAKNYHG
ncbi:MAG: cation:proton antiporter family protein [Candidatus Saccharimonadales bacterium]